MKWDLERRPTCLPNHVSLSAIAVLSKQNKKCQIRCTGESEKVDWNIVGLAGQIMPKIWQGMWMWMWFAAQSLQADIFNAIPSKETAKVYAHTHTCVCAYYIRFEINGQIVFAARQSGSKHLTLQA